MAVLRTRLVLLLPISSKGRGGAMLGIQSTSSSSAVQQVDAHKLTSLEVQLERTSKGDIVCRTHSQTSFSRNLPMDRYSLLIRQ